MTTYSKSGTQDATIELARQQRLAGKISREDYWKIVRLKLEVLSELQSIALRENLTLQIGPDNLQVEISLSGFNSRILMTLDVRDVRSVPFSVLADGPYEKFQGTILLELAKESSEFLDIGANMGYYSLAAPTVNSRIKVHAFEPQPNIYSALSKNISLNNLNHRVELHNLGLGSKESVMTMFIPPFTGSGGGSMANLHQDEGSPQEVEVRVKVLDEYLGSVCKPDLVKIDVEGYEFEVISGGMRLISQSRPTIIIELLRKWMKPFGKHPQDVVELLAQEGYQIYAISTDSLVPITHIDNETAETNFVFVHSSNLTHLAKIKNYV